MPPVPLQVSNAGLLRLVWANGGIPYAVNVMGFQGTASQPPTQSTADTLAVAIRSALSSSTLNSFLGTAISLTGVGIRNIHLPNQPELVGSGTPVSGTGVEDLLPPQTAFCVTLRTQLAGDKFRGRVFLTGFSGEANASTGAALDGVRTAAVNFITAIRTALGTANYQMAVIHRPVVDRSDPQNPVVTEPGSTEPITLIQGRDLIWDTQRRRAIPGI